MYWKESTPNNNQERSQESAADLEITAYIMLSKLFNMDKRALADLVPISRWITSKRNSLGGFYSTQDTVVALDALSEFARLSYSKNTNLKLAYYLNSGKSVVFVNELNRLLLRRIRLDRFIESGNNTLSFEADGLGTVLVQVLTYFSEYHQFFLYFIIIEFILNINRLYSSIISRVITRVVRIMISSLVHSHRRRLIRNNVPDQYYILKPSKLFLIIRNTIQIS